MNTISRRITGGIMILAGLVLTSLPLLFSFKDGAFMGLIYGIPFLVIGLFILFNKKEDKIERRKDLK